MTKIRKNFRFEEETIQKIEMLKEHLSKQMHVKLTETSLLEMLVSERFETVTKD